MRSLDKMTRKPRLPVGGSWCDSPTSETQARDYIDRFAVQTNEGQEPPCFSHLRCAVVILLLLICPVLALAAEFQELPAKEREAWVAEQIAKLDADTLRERAAAERDLLNVGPLVLPLLPPPELLPSVAVRQAVRRIRLRLEEAKARDSVKASKVTLDGTLPLKDILKKITEQTGNRIDAGRLPAEMLERSIPVEFRTFAFWETLEVLRDDFGFEIGSPKPANADAPRVRLIPAESGSEPANVTKGAFRVEVEPLKLRPRFGSEDQQLLRVPMRLMAEPRLRPLFLKLAGEDFTARTPDEKNLKPFNPAANLELPLGEEGTEISFDMDFQVPKPFPERSIQLAGKATLTVAAGSEEIQFGDLNQDAGAARRKAGVTVTLNEVEFQPDRKKAESKSARFRITVHYDTGGPAFESHRSWMFHNRVYLEDAQDRRIERNADFHTALQTDGGVVVEYNFDGLAGEKGDYKFIYVAPTLIINVPVEFQFENLPVPKRES